MDARPLLILDMDETMVRTVDEPLSDRQPDFDFEQQHVYKRPHLERFLRERAKKFRLAVWSAGQEDYVKHVISRIVPADLHLEFVWTHDQCTGVADADTMTVTYIKDLKSVKKLGYDLDRVVIVEDKIENCVRNLPNAVIVSHYLGEADDQELLKLAPYLDAIADLPNLRKPEKKSWRTVKPETLIASSDQKSRLSTMTSFISWGLGMPGT